MIAQLEFELTYYNVAVQQFSDYARKISPTQKALHSNLHNFL